MKNKITSIILIASLCLNPAFIWAESIHDNAGTSSAQFLKIGIGARPVAMGETYCALSDDAFGIFWNPAGLSRLTTAEYGVYYNLWLSNVSQEVIMASFPFKRKGTISGGGMFMHMPRLEGADIYGNETGRFNAYNLVGILSYSSLFFKDKLSLGANIKYINDTIETEHATGYCFDLGASYLGKSKKLSLGFAVQNIGSAMKFVSESFNLPRNIKMGAAYRIPKRNLLVLTDINMPVDSAMWFSFGGELNSKRGLILRGGWKSNGGITMGMGLVVRKIYNFDYALVPYESLGSTHRISLCIKFDAPRIQKVPEKKPKKEKPTTGSIFGKVIDEDDAPVRDAAISLSVDSEEILLISTEYDGTYSIEELEFDKYEIKAWKEDLQSKVEKVKVTDDPKELDLTIKAADATSNYIYGTVFDKSGSPSKGVVIIKVSQEEKEILRVTAETNGSYRTSELPYGDYEVKAWEKDTKTKLQKCKVTKTAPTQLNFILPVK